MLMRGGGASRGLSVRAWSDGWNDGGMSRGWEMLSNVYHTRTNRDDKNLLGLYIASPCIRQPGGDPLGPAASQSRSSREGRK